MLKFRLYDKELDIDLDVDYETEIENLLEIIQKDMFNACVERKNNKTTVAYSLEEIEKNLAENQGYVKTMWCGDRNCEDKVKEVTVTHKRLEKILR